jgi:hypothetical protein
MKHFNKKGTHTMNPLVKLLIEALSQESKESKTTSAEIGVIGEKCIVRTYSAGVYFGTVSRLNGRKAIVTNARRLWKYHASNGIELCAVAKHGIDQSKSRISEEVERVLLLEVIEVIPCSKKSALSIEGAPNAAA